MCPAVGVKTNLHTTGKQGSGSFDSAGEFSQVVGEDEEGQAGIVHLILTH
jgi:hypothetical protein